MAFYGSVEYWNQRYLETANSSPCEWYRGYGHLRQWLNPISFATSGTSLKIKGPSHRTSTPDKAPAATVTPSPPVPNQPTPVFEPFSFPDRNKARILILGCGNSSFGADMLRDGWVGPIVNVDFSATVIEQMEQKYGQHFYQHLSTKVATPMKFRCADITQPLDDLDDGSFDLIVCKGALDVILCSDGSKADALQTVQECHRLLAPGHGIFFVVSNGNPDNRLEYLEHQNSLSHYWRGVSVHVVPKQYPEEKPVYCYICRKRASDPLSTVTASGKENADVAASQGTSSSVDTLEKE